MTVEAITSLERIRAAITAHAGCDDSAELAADIDAALFGPPPGPDTWVGPQLSTEHLEELRLDHYQPLTDALGHIDAQAATIRNQNGIMAAQTERIRQLDAALDACVADRRRLARNVPVETQSTSNILESPSA